MSVSHAKEQHRVLIVDDEKLIAITLKQIFSGKGYEVRTAASAEQALQTMHAWVPDLAVLDVALPGMNGIDLALHLKARWPGCRLLLISGAPEALALVDGGFWGGHRPELLAKPVHPDYLLDRVAGLLA